jgi:hypothetical protein
MSAKATATAQKATAEKKWSSLKLQLADGRVALEFLPDGSTVFADTDIGRIVEFFWQAQEQVTPGGPERGARSGSPLFLHVGPKDGPTVILHPSGAVSTKNYTPDDRALRMWRAIAAAWPKGKA